MCLEEEEVLLLTALAGTPGEVSDAAGLAKLLPGLAAESDA